ncbi:MAG: hypothetical protein V4582_23125 [Pseudomonadota bacterium]
MSFLLPFEKLPPFLLGVIAIIGGAFFLFAGQANYWQLAKGLVSVIVGVWMVISTVVTILSEPDMVAQSDPSKSALPSAPDYATYSEIELRQIPTRIDRERFPARVEEIETRLSEFEAAGRSTPISTAPPLR